MRAFLHAALIPFLCGACGASEPVTVATYNAGLAPNFVDGAESRSPMVASAIAGLDADVVCLQEVWGPDDIAAVKAATEQAFPEQLWPEGGQSTLPDAACTGPKLDELLDCVDRNCAEQCDEYLDDCMLEFCGIKFVTAEPSCQGCIMANVGGEVSAIKDVCSVSNTEYAYEGAFGTAILSKHPILESEHIEMSATTNRRGVHHAVIKGPAGKMDVYCTHLTAVFEVLPYPREEGDWDEEQRAQVATLRGIVDDTAQTDQIVILGDFNTGPALGEDIVAEQQASWDALAEGYDVPYVDGGGACTWCGENPLIGGGEGHILDHVLVKGFEGESSASRVLDEGAQIRVCEEDTAGALSDHYGVSVTLTP